VYQSQQFSTYLYTTATFSKRLILDWLSLRHSRRPIFHNWNLCKSKSKSRYDGRSVSQYALMSSTFWFSLIFHNWNLCKSKSKSRYDGRSVSQYALMSSTFWFSWPDVCYCWRLMLCLCGAPSLTRGRVCRLSVRVCIFKSFVSTYRSIYIEVKVKLRPTVSRSVSLGVRPPSGIRDKFFFFLEIFFRHLRICNFVASSLTRGRVCHLLLLLVLASAVPLGSVSL
jgi:hypothetical protein